MKSVVLTGMVGWCVVASLCAAQSAEVQRLGYRFLPEACLELTVDAFEQLRGRRERVCTLTETIHSIRALPDSGSSQALQFHSGGDWIEVRGFSSQLGKTVAFFRIEAKELEVFCASLTVPRKDVEGALVEFREWLKGGVFEYTTKGGENVRLTPPVPFESVTLGVGKAGGAAVVIQTKPCEPADTEIVVLPQAASTWVETASAAGEVEGMLGGVEMSIAVESGVCRLQQADAPFEELKEQRERLRQMKSLEPFLNAAQRKIYDLQVNPQEQLLQAMEAKVAAAHGGGISGSWLLLIKNRISGHLYASAVIRGGKD